MKIGFDSKRLSFDGASKKWSSEFPDLDSDRTLVTVFGSSNSELVDDALKNLKAAYPKSIVVGCSTSGEIHGNEVRDESLSVGIARFAFTALKQAVVPVESGANSFDVGQTLAKSLAGPDLRAVFVLSDGLNVNGSELIRGMNATLPEDVIVTGGLAGDGTRFQATWVYADGNLGAGVVVGVGFYGKQFQIFHGSRGGWDKFGPERIVTKSQANVLSQLDNEPALELYEKYLGDKASELPSSGLLFPLAITPPNEDKVLVRTLLGIDRDAGTMTFAGDIPVGSRAQLMKANFDRLIDGAEEAAQVALGDLTLDGAGLTIAVSCVGRRLVLGDRTEDELDAISSIIDTKRSPLVGFYSYGELSPVADGRCDLHNQTMTLTIFSENALDTALLKKRLLGPKGPASAALPAPAVAAKPEAPKPIVPKPVAKPVVPTPAGGPAKLAPKADGNLSTLNSQAFVYDLKNKRWSAPLPDLDSAQTLVLAFGSPSAWDQREAFEALAKKYPNSHILGCSGSGEIAGTAIVDDSVSVTVTRFAKTGLVNALTRVANADDSFTAGQDLARQLDRPDLQAVFILSEGLNVNGTELVRGVNSIVDDAVVVTGGLAGDGARFERTWIYARGEVQTNAVAAVGFYGDYVIVSHGSQGGWDSFGPQRKVTRSEGNVVFELDGKPALALYKTYLGDKAKDLPASGLLFPLALLDANDHARNVVRTLLSVDHDKQSLTFAGDVPQGANVQLMKAHFDKLVDGAQTAAENAKLPIDGPRLALAVSCVGRRLVLGARTEEELEAVRDQVGSDAVITGFYSYGELSPVTDGKCDLHNQTMTLTVIGESATPVRQTTVLSATKDDQKFSTFGSVFKSSSQMWSEPLPDVDSNRTLVLIFGAPELRDQNTIFDQIRSKYPNSHIIGCSSSGEIAGTDVLDGSLSVTVTRFKHTDIRSTSTMVDKPEASFDAGKRIAENLNTTGLRAIFILSEGLGVNGTELVRGVNSVVDRSVVVTGGLAGDGARFEKTWVYADGKVESNKVAAIGLYGNRLVIAHGSQGGWDSFGPERVASRTEGNVVFELDGKPALALYKTYLGDKAKDLPGSGLLFPLALYDANDANRMVVRTLLAVDHDKQSLTFAGDIPQGAKVQLMKAHFDRLVEGAENAAKMAFIDDAPPSSLAIAISCVGRRLVLGTRTEDELDAVAQRLGEGATLTGFYSYGELSPVANGQCDLHNQTMTLTIFSETVDDGKEAPKDARDHSTAVDFDKTLARTTSGFASTACVYDLEKKQWSPHLPTRLDSPQTLALVFGSPDAINQREGFADLEASFPHAQIVGCSGSGEIAGNMVVDGCLSVAFVRFTKTLIKTVRVDVANADDSFEAGKRLAAELKSDALRAVFLLSEGLAVNGTELVRGVNSGLPESVVVTGGLAGDGTRFEKTWVYVDGEPRTNTVAAVGFYGEYLRISHGSQGGWDAFGPVRTVTRSNNNVLFELDGTPALTLYKTYLGDKAKDLPASGLLFPLSIIDQGDGQQRNVVRTLLSVDHEAQSLTFAGDIPEGAHVQLMKAHFDKLIEGAESAATMTKLADLNDNALAIAVSCVGRRLVLGQRTEDELEAVIERLPKQATLAGFYSYGELSPIAEGRCDLHNQTMTLTVFGESDTPMRSAKPATVQAQVEVPPPAAKVAASGLKPVPAPAAPATPAAPAAKPAPKPAAAPAPQPAAKVTPPPAKPAPAPKAAAPTVTAANWERPIIPVRSNDVQAGQLKVEKTENDGVTTIRLLGKLDEKFNGSAFGRDLRGVVVMDLAEVRRVTSFGVREWLAMLRESSNVDELYLVRCSEPISNQLATIRAFAGNARVVSFFAPYMCEHCQATFNALMDVEFDRADLASGVPPEVKCLRCGKPTRGLDEDPSTFFSFVQTDFDVPAFVRSQLEALPQYTAAEPVEKVVNETGTFIRLNVALDDTVRWRRILDGVEGAVNIDLSGVPDTTTSGVAAFVQALAKHVDDARFSISHVPYAVLTGLKNGNIRAKFDRVEVQGRLPDGSKAKAYVDMATVEPSLPNGPVSTHVEAGTLDLSESLALLCYAADVQPEAPSTPANQAAEPKAATPAPAVPTPAMAATPAAPVAPEKDYKPIIFGVLVVILVLAVIVRMNRDDKAEVATTPASETGAQTVTTPDTAPKPDNVKPANTEWSTKDGVRPAWADRAFSIDNNRVLIVGEATSKQQDAALDAARKAALAILIPQIQRELKGTEQFTMLSSAPAVTPEKAVETFLRQMGPTFSLSRVEQAFKTQDGSVTAVAQFELPLATFQAITGQYRETLSTELADFAMRFPTLDGPEEYDVVVLKSRTNRLLPRDVILSESQAAVYSLEQLKGLTTQKDFLRLVVNSNSVAKTVTIRVRQ